MRSILISDMEKRGLSISSLLLLIAAFLIYSTTGVFSKMASMHEMLSLSYIQYFSLVILAMGGYAVLWQLILKRVDLSKAFLFKSLTVIFSLFFAWSIFDETISLKNILGCLFIISGIVLNSFCQTE